VNNASDWQCTVVAHRGLWASQSVENSIDAFHRGVAHGFANECDVWLSADGVPVVIHDDTLGRTTTGHGPVAALTAAELRSVRLRDVRPNQHVPTLAEVSGVVHFVEIKQDDAERLVRETIRLMHGRRWLLQSFDPATIEHALGIDPALTVAILVETPAQLAVAIDRRWRTHIDHRMLDDRTAARLTDAGVDVGVWTVNTPEAVDRVLRYRPVAIISDDPMQVRSQLKIADGPTLSLPD
jgi:glycerophosphoryl diester phosphodiesterase